MGLGVTSIVHEYAIFLASARRRASATVVDIYPIDRVFNRVDITAGGETRLFYSPLRK